MGRVVKIKGFDRDMISSIGLTTRSLYKQDYFKRFFVLRSLEMIFSFLIKRLRLKAIEIETAFFHSLGNPKALTLSYFFYASHIRLNIPYRLIPISVIMHELVEIFLKLSMKTVQVHLTIGTTLERLHFQGIQYHLNFSFRALQII